MNHDDAMIERGELPGHNEDDDTYEVRMVFSGDVFRSMFEGGWSPPVQTRLEYDPERGWGCYVRPARPRRWGILR